MPNLSTIEQIKKLRTNPPVLGLPEGQLKTILEFVLDDTQPYADRSYALSTVAELMELTYAKRAQGESHKKHVDSYVEAYRQ